MSVQKYYLFFLTLVFSGTVYAQLSKDYNEMPPYYIKTAEINDGKQPMPSSIIRLGAPIYFSFDDLRADEDDYYYKIVRFDENWEESNLSTSEYIDGFESSIITEMQNSSNTFQAYTHYSVRFPNENTRILLSGNYKIQILDDEDNLIFSLPFIIYEQTINVGVKISWSNDVETRDSMQVVDFSLYTQSLPIQNESQTLSVRVFQNDNFRDYKEFKRPTFYKGNEWVYHYPNDAVFDGINEFMSFSSKDLRGVNYNVYQRELKKLYHFYLYTMVPRDKYLFRKDINGSYVIRSLQAEDPNFEADYIYAHFSLKTGEETPESIYVVGKFNHFMPSDEYELKYNEDTQRYEVSVLLKQGYYDYYYVTKDQDGRLNFSDLENSFSETENEYKVLVYYSAPGSRYVRIIGLGSASSRDIK